MNPLHRGLQVVAILVLVFSGASLSAQVSVTGRVLDRENKPVARASVSVMSLDAPEGGWPRQALTHDDGTFLLLKVPAGHYRFYVWDEAKGVPNRRSLIFEPQNAEYKSVEVSGPQTLEVGDLRLPDAFGHLRIQILDSRTGSKLLGSRCRVERSENPKIGYESDAQNGECAFYLPGRALKISVITPGFETWTYMDTASKAPYIVVGKADDIVTKASLLPNASR